MTQVCAWNAPRSAWTRTFCAPHASRPRAGRRDSEIVEDALRSYLAIGVLEEIWRTRKRGAPELSDDEALKLARDEQHAARKRG